jgi:hypothetical protein
VAKVALQMLLTNRSGGILVDDGKPKVTESESKQTEVEYM